MTDNRVPILDRTVLPHRAQCPPNAGRAIYAPGGTFGPRIQQDYQLVLLHTGSARVDIDGTTREIPAGHIGLLLPGGREHFHFARDRETEHSWVALPPRAITAELRRDLDRASHCLPLSSVLQDLVTAGIDAAAVDDPGRSVLLAVGQAALTLYAAEAAQLPSDQSTLHPAVARARELARRHACNGLTVGDLAREVGLSPEHLVRLFRRDLETTPGAILRAERLARGVHLLEYTGLPVANVAWQAGFASPHHFARLLRATTGMTPTELRARRWVGPLP